MDAERLEALAVEERRRYFREWRKKNPDKVRKHNRNYWRRRAQAKLQQQTAHESKPSADQVD